jgi:transcriptional regulator with XRE-family HTH domain
MAAGESEARDGTRGAFGAYLRSQRQLARLSLRQLAGLAKVSDAYLSQIERGLHQPSVAIIRALAESLQLSTEDLLAQAAGVAEEPAEPPNVEQAIRDDPRLNAGQRRALLAVYRAMVEDAAGGEPDTGRGDPAAGS